ncbi:MAG: endonuclease/exonuclease/phosphatase family protein [Acidobacteriota bacterium]
MLLLTWNVQYGKGADGAIDLARIASTARAMGDADVICFQELAINFPALDKGAGADQPVLLARFFPGYAPIFRPSLDFRADDGRRQFFGNMILSRLPVLQVMTHLLPRPADPGVRSMQRSALEAVIETRFGPLRIVTTHLEYFSAAHRMAQVDRLRDIHDEVCRFAAAPDAPEPPGSTYQAVPRPPSALLCGDFNLEPGWPEYERMLAPFEPPALGFRDAWPILRAGKPHAPTAGIYDTEQWANGPNCRDFVFVTEDLVGRLKRIEVDEKTPASDHQPVLVELR